MFATISKSCLKSNCIRAKDVCFGREKNVERTSGRIFFAICIKVEEYITVALIDDLLYVNLGDVDLVCHKLCQCSLVHFSKFLPEQIMSSICSWLINMNSSDEECILFQ